MSQVEYITWDFGDSGPEQDSRLELDKIYQQEGVYIVTQTIIFNDDYPPLTNVLNIYVRDGSLGMTTALSGSPLSAEVGDIFSFALTPIDIPAESYRQLVWECGDGTTRRASGQDQVEDLLTTTCTYAQASSWRVKAYLYIEGGDVFVNEMTVHVQ
jgi:hypothetical protein